MQTESQLEHFNPGISKLYKLYKSMREIHRAKGRERKLCFFLFQCVRVKRNVNVKVRQQNKLQPMRLESYLHGQCMKTVSKIIQNPNKILNAYRLPLYYVPII